jgi:uncharacterized protein YcnI
LEIEMIRKFACAAFAGAALLATGLPALAHMTLETASAAVGSTYKAVFRVPHGCGSAPTTTLRIQIPDGFYNVKPMPKAGWSLEVVIGPYETPYDNFGTLLTEGAREVIWSGGSLPNEFYDEFVLRGSFGSSLLPDTVFYFPAVQECANGETERWIDVSGDEGAEFPAPSLTLTPAGDSPH